MGGTRSYWVSGMQVTGVQHGPFWSIEHTSTDSIGEEELAGYFNVVQPMRGDKVVPVEIHWPNDSMSMFMSITRARANLKKCSDAYQYVLSDVAARAGRIQWDLECKPNLCVYYMDPTGGHICGDMPVADTVNIYGTQMPACHSHISAVRLMARNLRLQRDGARK
jgi:hypothetical protein